VEQVLKARVAANGRMVLPKAVRVALGVTEPGIVALSVEGDEVKLSSMASRIKRAQALYRKQAKDDYTVDDFLRERREEAAQDNAKRL
jgi:bifunctional DNA-binding transcriptional regulator/antitoxin component of YhaV-PrlF toxin-antitoxin module